MGQSINNFISSDMYKAISTNERRMYQASVSVSPFKCSPRLYDWKPLSTGVPRSPRDNSTHPCCYLQSCP